MPTTSLSPETVAISENDTPSFFYKYRAVPPGSDAERYVLETIRDDTVFFPSPSSFNDIFDCKPVMRAESTDEEFIEFFVSLCINRGMSGPRENLVAEAKKACGDPFRDIRIEGVSIAQQEFLAATLAKAGVYCVSEKNDDILMWSHYSDNHKGVCLEFDGMSHLMAEAMQVQYSSERPIINRLKENSAEPMMKKALLTKSQHWSYEYEWRIIHQVTGCGVVHFDHSTLTGIIFGAACEQSTINAISTANATRKRPLRLSKAHADNRHFQLNIVLIP